MQITELKHFEVGSGLGSYEGCLDNKHHAFVFLLKSTNDAFEIYYKNSAIPYKVKQTSGASRRVTDDEFSCVNGSCEARLNQEINKCLIRTIEYVETAKVVAKHLEVDDFEDYLSVAVRLCNSSTEGEMYYHLSEVLLWDMEVADLENSESAIENIIQDIWSNKPSAVSSNL